MANFGLILGVTNLKCVLGGKIRVDFDVTNFEDIFKADLEGSFEG
jgi:hypothetical protein